jgi:hypothetical protein
MRVGVTGMTTGATIAALLATGCARETPQLPTDPIDRAATCGIVAAATEREAAGVKGDLSAEAQGRIFQYPLLAASQGGAFDDATANAVFKRMPALSDKVVAGKWQTLRPACAAAYPATRTTQPTLPSRPLDSMLQCYVMIDFMRKALGNQGAAYNEATLRYGLLGTKLDAKVSPALARAGIRNGTALSRERSEALAAAAKLGQPATVIDACAKKYG